jgi:outer membrane protein assembly factor BamB
MRRLILPFLIVALCSLALAQDVGDHPTAGFTFNRTQLHSHLGDVKPPLRLFETIPLTGTSNADSLIVFDGLLLVGEGGSPTKYHFYSGSNRLWSVNVPGGKPTLNYVPAYANDLVILGGTTTASIQAVEVSGGGAVKWQKNNMGDASGRYPILTGRLALFHGKNWVVAANAATGATIWQYPNTAQGAAALAEAPLSLFGNRVYVLDEQKRLHALDLRTGTAAWITPHAGGHGSNVIATEKWVYLSDPATGNFGALDAATGTVVNWAHTYPPEGRAFAPNRGIALAYGNLYTFAGSHVAAYSAETGELLWEYNDLLPSSIGDILPVTPPTPASSIVDYPVIANNVVYYYNRMTGRLRALDAFSGTLIWSVHEPGVRAIAAADSSLYLLLGNSLRVYTPVHETYMAEVGSGGGITTLVTLNNMSSEPATATAFFLDEEGDALSLPIAGLTGDRSEVSLNIPPFSTAAIQVLERPQFTGGWVGVISDQPLRGTSIFQSRMGGEVVSEVGVGDSPATGFANVYVTREEGFNTALALANPSTEGAYLTFKLLNAAGTEVASAWMELGSLAQRARFVNELFAPGAVPVGTTGTLVIEADVPVSITAIRTKNGTFISSYPVGQPVR